ncbi:outer membrane beta-barrel protein [Methylocapsa polymorpha]|uniref:Outer membrane beta-barrel protein n=1 Tax=Methylocapsa polymorpha TaxID=3080828 RepID=A0ABZ0HW02_9HYPH|nr:outer membrane beta-barrel protein [Methylocapsa sp. RX1]
MFAKRIPGSALIAISTILAGLSPQAAGAADLPVVPAPVFVAAGVNWDGFYAGIHGGLAVGSTTWSNPTGYFAADRGLAVPPDVAANSAQSGLIGGLQVGYNRQFGAFVFGFEADASFGPLNGYAACGAVVGLAPAEAAFPVDAFMRGSKDPCHTSIGALASATGRFGYAFGRTLIFVKGGVAYSSEQYDVINPDNFPANPAQASADRFGWTVGVGLEYALGGNWSAKGEYDYYDFGTQTIGFTVPGYPTFNSFSIRRDQHLAKFGLNYRFADTGGGADISAPAPAFVNDITGEFGGRVGFSNGRYQDNLFGFGSTAERVSRLTWPNQTGVSLESFARADHISGLFAKGYFGGVDLLGSHMNDEDFPPGTNPYSNTLSKTERGRDFYASADLGYTFLRGNTWRIGGFLGFHYYSQIMNSYGCTQVGGGDICEPGATAGNALLLSENERWRAARVGLGGDVMLTDRLKWSAEAVWLPYMTFQGTDNHWLRSDINPLPQSGHGFNGFQAESVLSYALTERIDVGVGARYWLFQAQHGFTQFPDAAMWQATTFTSMRYGVFAQASYKFGDVAAPPVIAKY